MFDRNDFDLRIATHTDTVARINETGWQRQSPSRAMRAVLAGALTAVAALLAPAPVAGGARSRADQKRIANA